MAKYSAQLVAKSSENKNVTTTLSNVNPETEPVKIKQFAQTLNALTTNTYNETNYIVTMNLDTEADTRQTPTLTYVAPTLAQVQEKYRYDVSYNGDGNIYVKRISGCINMEIATNFTENAETGAVRNTVTFYGPQATAGGTFAICATGTDNYKPIEVEYTIT